MKKLIVAVLACVSTLCGCQCHKADNDMNVTCGGYSKEAKVTAQEMEVWDSVAKIYPMLNELTPETVKSQVVAGMNYDFSCRDKQGKPQSVKIFMPLPGEGTPSVLAFGKRLDLNEE